MVEKHTKDFNVFLNNKNNYTEPSQNFPHQKQHIKLNKPSSKIKSFKFSKNFFSPNYK